MGDLSTDHSALWFEKQLVNTIDAVVLWRHVIAVKRTQSADRHCDIIFGGVAESFYGRLTSSSFNIVLVI